MTEAEIELAARLSNVEYLLRVIMLNHLASRPDPVTEAKAVRRAMLDRTRYGATVPAGTDPDIGMAVQTRTVGALERWFDALEDDLRRLE